MAKRKTKAQRYAEQLAALRQRIADIYAGACGRDVDVEGECVGFEELARVARDAERVRGDGAHAVGAQVAEALPELFQAGERPLARALREAVVLVEPGGQTHLVPQPVDDDRMAVDGARHDHVEAVRSEVDRGQGLC